MIPNDVVPFKKNFYKSRGGTEKTCVCDLLCTNDGSVQMMTMLRLQMINNELFP